MCTNITIPRKSKDEALVSARTMDWCIRNPENSPLVNFVPRKQKFPEIDLPGEIHWKNKYGFIGAGYKLENFPVAYSDGLNEKGLSVASLWLACSEYPKPKKGEPLLYNMNLVSYVLGNFKNIQEVETALSKLTVVNITNLYPEVPALFHYIISDASGKHLIVEFIDGVMQTYTTDLGVLTNQPTYDWHLTNLNFYGNLSLKNNPDLFCGEEVTGSGQLGMPGDPSPQSRFIRAAFLRQTAFKPENTQQSIGLARLILQNLSVPIGTVIFQDPRFPEGTFDWTQWSVIRDHTNLGYYFYSDFNSTLYGIHLKQLDFKSSKQKQFPIYQPDWYENITKNFK
ncbi:linear amide C-N hydrolase [Salipaludibacillus aurantiacus]|uniref:Choloylglycine hydrolase n=1 Tax=Salipaludibacillus aurantiacus TaxID=1601833 RepID=A0A1H9Q7N9_9BACI|nr:linear amide C-N hydrolase [Salipaludibacillus aurantiacus]SER56428.1 choloylglycine hydrolase [Salipaludibacillus aurantiacus]